MALIGPECVKTKNLSLTAKPEATTMPKVALSGGLGLLHNYVTMYILDKTSPEASV